MLLDPCGSPAENCLVPIPHAQAPHPLIRRARGLTLLGLILMSSLFHFGAATPASEAQVLADSSVRQRPHPL